MKAKDVFDVDDYGNAIGKCKSCKHMYYCRMCDECHCDLYLEKPYGGVHEDAECNYEEIEK